MGRPRINENEKRRPVSVSLGPAEIEALRELSDIREESQGHIVGSFILREIAKERKKA